MRFRGTVQPSDWIELGVDTRNLHFFDPSSGLAIAAEHQCAFLTPRTRPSSIKSAVRVSVE